MREVLLNDHTIKDETRKHLATLNNYGTHKKRKSLHQGDYGNEINSTGSFLSDLTQSEDDFLEGVSTNQKFKKHHPSVLNNTSLLNASVKKNRKSIETRRSTRREYFVKYLKSFIYYLFKFQYFRESHRVRSK